MPKSENHNADVLTPKILQKVEEFEAKDTEWRDAFNQFLEAHPNEVTILDRLREERNELLDEVRRGLRDEVVELDITDEKRRQVKVGKFRVQKKWTSWFIVEDFVDIARGCGMYDSAVSEGIIQEVTNINGDLATEWLRKNSLTDKFEVVIDGKELTPAVYGPKEIPPLGSEKK